MRLLEIHQAVGQFYKLICDDPWFSVEDATSLIGGRIPDLSAEEKYYIAFRLGHEAAPHGFVVTQSGLVVRTAQRAKPYTTCTEVE